MAPKPSADGSEIPALTSLNRLFAGALWDVKTNTSADAHSKIVKLRTRSQKNEVIQNHFQAWCELSVSEVRRYFPQYLELGLRYSNAPRTDLAEWAEQLVWEIVVSQCDVVKVGDLRHHISRSVKWWFAVASEGNVAVNWPERAEWKAPSWLAANASARNVLLEDFSERLSLRFLGVLDDEKERSRVHLALREPQSDYHPRSKQTQRQSDQLEVTGANLPGGLQEGSSDICAACGHPRIFHRAETASCFGDPKREANISKSDIDIGEEEYRKSVGAECWCPKFELDCDQGITSALKNGDAAAVMRQAKLAMDRGDRGQASLLVDNYVLKTSPEGRDSDWVAAMRSSISQVPLNPALKRPDFPKSSKYPSAFSAQARNRIEAERLRANNELEESLSHARFRDSFVADAESILRKYILKIFLAFAREACALGSAGLWTVDVIRSISEEYLRRLTIEAYYDKGHDSDGHRLRPMTSNWDGSIQPEVRRKFHQSEEWKKFENALLTVAEVATPTQERDSVNARIAVTSSEASPSIATKTGTRRLQVDQFIQRIQLETGQKINRKAIWSVAGYGDPTEFERFQRNDSRTSASAVRNFTRVLKMDPSVFVCQLDKASKKKNRS